MSIKRIYKNLKQVDEGAAQVNYHITTLQKSLVDNIIVYWKHNFNPFTPKSDFIDFTLSKARQFYSSKGDPLGVKGLKNYLP